MWPLSGVLAAILIVIGIVLLIAYAVRRGLVQHDLPDTIERLAVPTGGAARAVEPASQPRVLGAVGAVVLLVGLALGVVTAVSGWGDSGSGGGGCAQSWSGCPQQTAPNATDAPPSVVP
jgi:hypothetical protein